MAIGKVEIKAKMRMGMERLWTEAKENPDDLIISVLAYGPLKAEIKTIDDAFKNYVAFTATRPAWVRYKINQVRHSMRHFRAEKLSTLTTGKFCRIMEEIAKDKPSILKFFFHYFNPAIVLACENAPVPNENRPESAKDESANEVEVRHQIIDLATALDLVSTSKGRFAEFKDALKAKLAKLPKGQVHAFQPPRATDKKEIGSIKHAINLMFYDKKAPYVMRYSKLKNLFLIFHKEDFPTKGDKKHAK